MNYLCLHYFQGKLRHRFCTWGVWEQSHCWYGKVGTCARLELGACLWLLGDFPEQCPLPRYPLCCNACPCCSRASPCTVLHSSNPKVRTGGLELANLQGPFQAKPKALVLWFHGRWSHSAEPFPSRLAGCTVGHSELDALLCCKHGRGCSKDWVLCSLPEICWGLHYCPLCGWN